MVRDEGFFVFRVGKLLKYRLIEFAEILMI